jgi:hypothetical protein
MAEGGGVGGGTNSNNNNNINYVVKKKLNGKGATTTTRKTTTRDRLRSARPSQRGGGFPPPGSRRGSGENNDFSSLAERMVDRLDAARAALRGMLNSNGGGLGGPPSAGTSSAATAAAGKVHPVPPGPGLVMDANWWFWNLLLAVSPAILIGVYCQFVVIPTLMDRNQLGTTGQADVKAGGVGPSHGTGAPSSPPRTGPAAAPPIPSTTAAVDPRPESMVDRVRGLLRSLTPADGVPGAGGDAGGVPPPPQRQRQQEDASDGNVGTGRIVGTPTDQRKEAAAPGGVRAGGNPTRHEGGEGDGRSRSGRTVEEQLHDLRQQMELLEEQIQQQQQQQQQSSSGAPTKGISPNIRQRHIDERANRQQEQGQQLQEQQQQLQIQQQQHLQPSQQPPDESSSSRSSGGVVGAVFFVWQSTMGWWSDLYRSNGRREDGSTPSSGSPHSSPSSPQPQQWKTSPSEATADPAPTAASTVKEEGRGACEGEGVRHHLGTHDAAAADDDDASSSSPSGTGITRSITHPRDHPSEHPLWTLWHKPTD